MARGVGPRAKGCCQAGNRLQSLSRSFSVHDRSHPPCETSVNLRSPSVQQSKTVATIGVIAVPTQRSPSSPPRRAESFSFGGIVSVGTMAIPRSEIFSTLSRGSETLNCQI